VMADLLKEAEARGFKRGWAYYRFREMFGDVKP